MRLLVISNMFPGRRKPNFGVFVADRVRAYREAGIEVFVVSNSDPRRGVRTIWKYAVLVLRSVLGAVRRRPDVIEGHYLLPTSIITAVAARLVRRPYVLYAHGSDTSETGGVIDRLVAWAVRGAAEVHTNSEFAAAVLGERFPRLSPVLVIPPGIDINHFRPDKRKQPSMEPVIVYLGDLKRHKGVDVLLRSLELLKDHSWRCRIAGGGTERKLLLTLASDLGIQDRLEWLGAIPHEKVPALFSSADLVVVPSRRDALGQVALEALACGVPVVVSAVGGLAAIPTPACGQAVVPDDPSRLADAIRLWMARSADLVVREAAIERASAFALDQVAMESIGRLKVIMAGSQRGQNAGPVTGPR